MDEKPVGVGGAAGDAAGGLLGGIATALEAVHHLRHRLFGVATVGGFLELSVQAFGY